MNCILKKCAHPSQASCQSFGWCGAAHLIKQAKREGGITVHHHNNRTLKAVMEAKLVSVEHLDDRLATVRPA